MCTSAKTERLNKAKFNIEHNGELSDQEKWRALDKVRGVQLGTTEQEFRQKELEKREQQIREDERRKLLDLVLVYYVPLRSFLA
ncbi:hypothetical protein ABMB44_13430 [Levilactobacillus brevis]